MMIHYNPLGKKTLQMSPFPASQRLLKRDPISWYYQMSGPEWTNKP